MTKKLLLCLVLVLLGVSAQGQALSPRLDSLLVYLNHQLGLPWPGDANGIASQAYLQYSLNRSLVRISTTFPAIEKFDTIKVTSVAEGYALNSDFDSLRQVYRMVQGVRVPLQDTSETDYYIARGGIVGAVIDPTNPDLPRYAHTVGNRLFFYPALELTSGDSAMFLVEYYALAPQLTALSDTTIMPQKYLQAVLDFATAIVERARGNFTAAREYEAAALGTSINVDVGGEDRK